MSKQLLLLLVFVVFPVLSYPSYMRCGLTSSQNLDLGRITRDAWKSTMWQHPIPDPSDVSITVSSLAGTEVQAYTPGETYSINIANERVKTDMFDDVTSGTITEHVGGDPSKSTGCLTTKWYSSASKRYTYKWQAPSKSEKVTISHFTASGQGTAVLKILQIGTSQETFESTEGTSVVDSNAPAELARGLYIPFMVSMLHMQYRTKTVPFWPFALFSVAYVACLIAYQFTDSIETVPSLANDDGFVYYVLPGSIILALMSGYAISKRPIRALTALAGLSLTTLPMNHLWHIKYNEQPDQRPWVLAYWALTLLLFTLIGYYKPGLIYRQQASRVELACVFLAVAVVSGFAIGDDWYTVHIAEEVVTSVCVLIWIAKIAQVDLQNHRGEPRQVDDVPTRESSRNSLCAKNSLCF